ncbi:MAG: hypothetical protein OIN87_12940 [Candidatus Methanoperedens sp.]|nr:hypothetical protein [Candidatus Methanoperedens sp.]
MNSTQDQIKGNVRKIKDDIKETAGKHINNPDMGDENIVGKEDIPKNHILMSGKEKAKTKR